MNTRECNCTDGYHKFKTFIKYSLERGVNGLLRTRLYQRTTEFYNCCNIYFMYLLFITVIQSVTLPICDLFIINLYLTLSQFLKRVDFRFQREFLYILCEFKFNFEKWFVIYTKLKCVGVQHYRVCPIFIVFYYE